MIHTVQFAFKPSLTAAKIAELGAAFLSLKDKCLDPDTKRPYILSLTGGRDNSPEGLQVFFFISVCQGILLSHELSIFHLSSPVSTSSA